MITEREHRKHIVDIGRRMYECGMVAATDGNISVRLGEGQILTTPTMMCKGRLSEDMMVVVDQNGNKLRQDEPNPSSELPMHLAVYRLRADVHSVVHAHPPFGTGFAVANVPLDRPLLSEVILTLGCIPLTAYGTPSTDEVVESLTPYIPHHDALLLANHGAVSYGKDLETAYARMETLEHFAKITLIAKLVGHPSELSAEAVGKLLDVRERAGYMGPQARACQSCGYLHDQGATCGDGAGLGAGLPRNEEETVTLTRTELNALITEAARLVAGELGR
ncbi:MAG TPA: class II aldolase/adducin family protein [Blastocatellia bacterium]|nr:class II aldolase/adducin family protein [Blastocatellia bacterium]